MTFHVICHVAQPCRILFHSISPRDSSIQWFIDTVDQYKSAMCASQVSNIHLLALLISHNSALNCKPSSAQKSLSHGPQSSSMNRMAHPDIGPLLSRTSSQPVELLQQIHMISPLQSLNSRISTANSQSAAAVICSGQDPPTSLMA